MKSHTIIRIFAAVFILAGLAGLLPLAYFWEQNHNAAKQAAVPIRTVALQPSPTLVTGRPRTVSIPSLNINLQVIDGNYDRKTGEWTLTLNKAQFATPSVQPNNQTGNTLIYGHYRPQVFAYLHHITTGAQATITTDNGYTFTYTYQNTEALNPADTSIFAYRGAPRLTIQTCSGAFMQNRQMYYFAYDSYKKTV
jgi:LPXTG-site transpeptidase (sortase) family protein